MAGTQSEVRNDQRLGKQERAMYRRSSHLLQCKGVARFLALLATGELPDTTDIPGRGPRSGALRNLSYSSNGLKS